MRIKIRGIVYRVSRRKNVNGNVERDPCSNSYRLLSYTSLVNRTASWWNSIYFGVIVSMASESTDVVFFDRASIRKNVGKLECLGYHSGPIVSSNFLRVGENSFYIYMSFLFNPCTFDIT